MPSPFTALLGTSKCPTPWTAIVAERGRDRRIVVDATAGEWPFVRVTTPRIAPSMPTLVVLEHLGSAFPDGQGGATRLVLTQPTYQLQRWLDWLAHHPAVSVVADLSAASPQLVRDAQSRRGPWSRIDLIDVAPRHHEAATPSASPLYDAFRQPSPMLRYDVCRRAVAASEQPDPVTLLALASACLEVGRLDDAFAALERARRGDPDWEAVHFESGKAWLRADDTARAAEAFAEAARLMPSFAAAQANLGAALGELDRPGEALIALDRAVALDPTGYPAHNSRGACLRDLGRLPEAEACFRRVIELRSDFPFGYYNLGHALFLEGRFGEARQVYEQGLERDPSRTPWQEARLALACAAVDDAAAASAHAAEALRAVPAEGRQELCEEMREVLDALAELSGTTGAIRALTALVTQKPEEA